MKINFVTFVIFCYDRRRNKQCMQYKIQWTIDV